MNDPQGWHPLVQQALLLGLVDPSEVVLGTAAKLGGRRTRPAHLALRSEVAQDLVAVVQADGGG
jgi:hypothetical protein